MGSQRSTKTSRTRQENGTQDSRRRRCPRKRPRESCRVSFQEALERRPVGNPESLEWDDLGNSHLFPSCPTALKRAAPQSKSSQVFPGKIPPPACRERSYCQHGD